MAEKILSRDEIAALLGVASGKVEPEQAQVPIRDKLSSGFSSEQFDADQSWTTRLRSQIEQCTASVTAELGSALLNVNEVGRLAVGDVIVLDTGVSDELRVTVEGRSKFLGKMGIYRGKPAVQISRVITVPQEEQRGE